MSKLSQKKSRWLKRKLRTRKKIFGSDARPRLCVYRSGKHIYAQLINDVEGITLASSSTVDKSLRGKARGNVKGAQIVGKTLAAKAKQKGVSQVVFDRHGFQYHGQLKALAEAAREGGLKF